jgi:arylsulfatase A-like enzyme
MKNARLPANSTRPTARPPGSPPARSTSSVQPAGNTPWLCHLSYIKPHWPYIVPAPYNELYGPQDVLPATRHPVERENPHPVYRAFMENPIGRAFSRDEVRREVIPAYMGLIAQCDDHLGRLLDHLSRRGDWQTP